MLKIGITGGIGSGKTTVCRIFELLGISIYSADEEAKKILNEFDVKKSITNYFGNDVLNSDKNIDRKKLANLVFNDKENLQKLNSIVHPAVAKHFEEWCNKNQSSKYVLKEAAIMFESGAYKQVDNIIVVTAPVDLKIKRSVLRDNITEEQVIERMNNQLTDEEKIKRSQFVIYNDEQQLLIPQVLQIHQQILKL